jgi:hypothetical protein
VCVHKFFAIVAGVVVSLLAVEFVNAGHLIGGKLEIEQVDVLEKSGRVGSLGDNSGLTLDTPLKADLCRGFVVSGSDGLDGLGAGKDIVLSGKSDLDVGRSTEVGVAHHLGSRVLDESNVV